MSKITYALISIFFIDLAMYLFGGQTLVGTALLIFGKDLSQIDVSSFYNIFFSPIAAFAVAGTVIAGLYLVRSDFAFYAGVALVLISFTAVLANLAIYISSHTGEFLGQQVSLIVSGIIMVPFIIQYVITLISLIGGRQD